MEKYKIDMNVSIFVKENDKSKSERIDGIIRCVSPQFVYVNFQNGEVGIHDAKTGMNDDSQFLFRRKG